MPGAGRTRRAFCRKITDHLVVIDPRDYPLNGIDDAVPLDYGAVRGVHPAGGPAGGPL